MSEKIETVYTKDGRCGKLIRKESDNKFLIQLYMNYAEWVGDSEYGEVDSYSELSENMIYTDVIYQTPPTELIDPKIIELRETVKSLSEQKKELIAEISKQQRELKQTLSFKTDLEKWHFDLSQFRNAKKVICFTLDRIAPFIIDMPKYQSDFSRIDLTIKLYLDGEQKSHIYTFNDWGDREYNPEKIDTKYGFMFDISDEEITRITLERSETLPLEIVDSWRNGKGGTPQKYLSDRFNNYISEKANRDKLQLAEDLKAKIESQRIELEKLTNQ